jgi:hypothetical protein
MHCSIKLNHFFQIYWQNYHFIECLFQTNQATTKGAGQSLHYHYTNEKGLTGIVNNMKIQMSTKGNIFCVIFENSLVLLTNFFRIDKILIPAKLKCLIQT